MGFFYSDDPVRDFARHDAEQEAWVDSLPKCEWCGEPIQDEEYYEIEGAYVHLDCLTDYCDKHCKKHNEYL
jgi:hypothetical protein